MSEPQSNPIVMRRHVSGPGIFAIFSGTFLMPLSWLAALPFSEYMVAGCWVLIAVGCLGMLRGWQPDTQRWVRHGEVPQDWQGKQVWHYVAHQKGMSLTTWTRERFDPSKPDDDVYFALAEFPEAPQHGEQA